MARTRGRPRHPKKEIEEAIQYAEARGWRIEVGGSHRWGFMYCPEANGCDEGIDSTPANPYFHARRLKRAVDRCPHTPESP